MPYYSSGLWCHFILAQFCLPAAATVCHTEPDALFFTWGIKLYTFSLCSQWLSPSDLCASFGLVRAQCTTETGCCCMQLWLWTESMYVDIDMLKLEFKNFNTASAGSLMLSVAFALHHKTGRKSLSQLAEVCTWCQNQRNRAGLTFLVCLCTKACSH